MRRLMILLLIAGGLCAVSRMSPAQQAGAKGARDSVAAPRPILSPRDSVSLSLDTNVISINYGRPSMRGRKIMGQLVPWNKVWRTGANQATHLRTSFDMSFGGVPVPRGTYTLWTLPSPEGWKVIINKQIHQWGTVYNASLDLARLDATVTTLAAPVDTMTMVLSATGTSSGIFAVRWENTQVSVPFQKNDHIRPLSPSDSATVSFAGKEVAIRYSRPYMRGRAIWGIVVPYDSLWRTGANGATSLTCDIDLNMGGVTVPRGFYSLYSIPTENAFTLIISKKPAGREPDYDPKMDFARISMKRAPSAKSIDPFRIWFEHASASRATLMLGWADRTYSLAVQKK